MYTIINICDPTLVTSYNKQIPYKDTFIRFALPLLLGKKVIMGRETYEELGSLVNAKEKLVFSNTPGIDLSPANVLRQASLFADRQHPFAFSDEEVIILGGQSIIELFLPVVDKIILIKMKDAVELPRQYGEVIDAQSIKHFPFSMWEDVVNHELSMGVETIESDGVEYIQTYKRKKLLENDRLTKKVDNFYGEEAF